MAQISIVQYKDILQARRFDAEYFKHEYVKTDKIIKSIDWDYFDKTLVEITGGNAFKSDEFGKGTIKVLKYKKYHNKKMLMIGKQYLMNK